MKKFILIGCLLSSAVSLAEEQKTEKKWDICKFKQDKETVIVSCSKTKMEDKLSKEIVHISSKVVSKIKRTYENGILVSEQVLPNE